MQIKLIATLVALAAIITALFTWQVHTYKSGYSAGKTYVQELWDKERAQASAAAASAQKKIDEQEVQIATIRQEILVNAKIQSQQRANTATRYTAAASGVLDIARHTACSSDRDRSQDTPATSGGDGSSQAGDMQSDLLRWYASRAGELANAADSAYDALHACQRAYGALIQP